MVGMKTIDAAQLLPPLRRSRFGSGAVSLRRLLPALLLGLLLLLGGCRASGAGGMHGASSPGRMDLSGVVLEESGAIPLEGEWELYPGRFYDPRSEELPQDEARYLRVPGFWNRQHSDLSPNGYATLRLELTLPEEGARYGLYMEEVLNAYRLYLDGELLLQSGEPGKSRAEYRAFNVPRHTFFTADTQTVELVLHVANYRDIKAGLFESPLIGTQRQIDQRHLMEVGLELFILGGILVMGLYYLILAFFRGGESTSLYFSLLCFAVTLRTALTGSRFLPWIAPAPGYEFYTALEFISIYIAALAMYLYFRSRFPKESWRPMTLLTYIVFAFLCVATIVTPVRTHARFFVVFELYLLPWLAAIILGSVYALRRQRSGATVFLASFLILALFIPIDLIYFLQGIGSAFFLHYGLFLFIMVHAASLAHRFTLLEKNARYYAAWLENQNASLSDQVSKQNRELNVIQRSQLAGKRRDFLTGLSNEEHLYARLGKLMREWERGKGADSLAVISLDIEGFSELNRQRGKSFTDFLLIHCASLLEKQAVEDTQIFRGSADEFVVLMQNATRGEAEGFLNAFREDIRRGEYLPAGAADEATQVIPRLRFAAGINCAVRDEEALTPLQVLENARAERQAERYGQTAVQE
jgi:diguanylate cyclase (GGDEF)-like protein